VFVGRRDTGRVLAARLHEYTGDRSLLVTGGRSAGRLDGAQRGALVSGAFVDDPRS
jgi:predicted phosphoribosyltransferase